MGKKLIENQRGLTTVEFAIVATLFLTLLFGVIDFGFLLYNQQVITNAGREGARLGVVARPNDYKITNTDIEQEVKDFAEDHIVSVGDDNFTVNASFASGELFCNAFQDILTVDVTYDYTFIFLPFGTKSLGTRSIMVCE
jgi:Flp pilus assembly protein TadG